MRAAGWAAPDARGAPGLATQRRCTRHGRTVSASEVLDSPVSSPELAPATRVVGAQQRVLHVRRQLRENPRDRIVHARFDHRLAVDAVEAAFRPAAPHQLVGV